MDNSVSSQIGYLLAVGGLVVIPLGILVSASAALFAIATHKRRLWPYVKWPLLVTIGLTLLYTLAIG
ncbi:MAG TPA: hypothetical protein VIH52_04685 [Candidatus Nanoarchaeia archaeon]